MQLIHQATPFAIMLQETLVSLVQAVTGQVFVGLQVHAVEQLLEPAETLSLQIQPLQQHIGGETKLFPAEAQVAGVLLFQ